MKKFFLLSLAVAALAVSPIRTIAQTSKGILVGVTRDSTGAVIQKAVVTVTGQDSGAVRSVSTKSDGTYRIDALDPGRYNIAVTQSGFRNFEANSVSVPPSVVTSYDVTLTIGSGAETVEVTSVSATINTENGQLTGIVGAREIDKLPVLSLNPFELAKTVPGVQVLNQGSNGQGQEFTVNGARPRSNNFLLDGQEINDVAITGQAFQPNIPDIYESLAVITNNASAEYGRAGGAVSNLVTKSGTNTFHGTAFERYTGSGLNALDGVTRQGKITGVAPPKKTRFDTQNYGFTAGGPIIKNKLFAFGAASFNRFYGSEQASFLQLPDAEGLATLNAIGGPQVALLNQYVSNGSYLTIPGYVHSQTLGNFADPKCVNGGKCIVSKINVGAQNGCPSTGCVVTTGFFQRPSTPEINTNTQWTYKIDYKPRDKDSFAARYLHSRNAFSPDFLNNSGALIGFDTLQGGPSELGEGTWTHVFTPNILNEFRVSETRVHFAFSATPDTLANPLNNLASIGVGGFPALGPNQNFPQGRGEDLYQLQDTVGWTIGKQSLRIGFDIGRQIETDLVSQNAKGALNFAAGGSGSSSLGNFLFNQLGPSGSATKAFGPTRLDPHNWRSGFFAQDDIKLTANLTVNLGLRYDYLSDPQNSTQFPGLDPLNPFAPITNVYPIKNDYNNLGPRVGFAYVPHFSGFLGDGKSVIRGGFGVLYDSFFSNITTNSVQGGPNGPNGTIQVVTGNGQTNATGQIALITPTLTNQTSVGSGVVNNLVNPLTYQYNLGVERELPAGILLGIRYVGSRGEKLYANQQYNFFVNGARVSAARGIVTARGNFGDSDYNSLQVDASHRFSHGFQIGGNYTYGKDLDNASEVFGTFNQATSFSANLAPGGRGQEWANSAYDHRHYLSLSYVYSPVGFHSQNTFLNAAYGALTRHWTVSGTNRYQSGPYSTFQASVDTNQDGSNANDRPVLGSLSAPITSVGIDGAFLAKGLNATTGVLYDVKSALNSSIPTLVPVTADQVHWLITFQPQNQDLHREIGRDSFLNPGTMFNNLAVEKGIGLSYVHFERGQLIFRAEIQDIANHNNRLSLDTTVNDAGGGFLSNNTRQGDGRTVFLWAKVQF